MVVPTFALELAEAFGIRAEFWMIMQSKGDVFQARKKAAWISGEIQSLRVFFHANA